MELNLPVKKYFTFDELAKKLNCSLNDLRHYIVNGQIVPSVFLDRGNYEIYEFQECFDGDKYLGFGIENYIHFDDVTHQTLSGFQYLIQPQQTGPNDCCFDFVSDKSRNHEAGDLCFRLVESYGLDYLCKHGVVMLAELARFENKPKFIELDHANETTLPKQLLKPLGTRERDTLLTIIAALCKVAGHDYKQPAKTAEVIEGEAAEMGISISKRAIQDHLNKIPNALAPRVR
jgi:hypothetical protein